MSYRLSEEYLKELQGYPLDIKIALSKQRIREFAREFGDDMVYVSYSGGKDSQVLLDLVRQVLSEDITVVYLDTWLEYPEQRSFVYSQGIKNLVTIKPDMGMKDIIDAYGFCVPSKDVSDMVYHARKGTPWAVRKINGLDKNGNYSRYRTERFSKWKYLMDAPFEISANCCNEMKEKPVIRYERESGKHGFIGTRVGESERRKQGWLKTGCNAFAKDAGGRSLSKPLSFWTEQDILHYIVRFNLPLSPVYGKIMTKQAVDTRQLSIFDLTEEYTEDTLLKCSGEQRTGCLFCPVGCHLDGGRKLELLKRKYPMIYKHMQSCYNIDEVYAYTIENYGKVA